MTTADDPRGPRALSSLLSPVRALLHAVIKIFVLFSLGIYSLFRPKVVRYGLVALVLVGVVGWSVLGGMFQGRSLTAGMVPIAQQGGTFSVSAATQLPQSPVVEQYLTAQASFNARGMWDSVSDELKQAVGASDASLQQLQAELDSARQQGRRYIMATYVGGVPMSDGRSVYFYVLTVSTADGTSDVPYIYVVGRDGKIVSIQ